MRQRSPTLEGFRILFRMPSLGMAEIAWRWSVGASFAAAATFAVFEYLDSLPVTAGDLFLLRTHHPLMVSRALAHILAGSAFRFLTAVMILLMAAAIGWIIIGSVGRTITLKTVFGYFFPDKAVSPPLGRIIELNSLRAVTTLASAIATFGALLLAGLASPKEDPSPAIAMLIFLSLALLIWLCWGMLNWLLSLATILAMTESETTMGALAAAIELLRQRTGPIVAASAWFGLAHGVAYVFGSSVVAFPMAFVGLLPGSVVFGGVLLTLLFYFAIVDYLYMGRLAAYVFIANSPEETRAETLPPAPVPDPPSHVDPGELIMSDLPLGQAPA
jgi:hypothetical protein